MKKRLDIMLVERGFFKTRAKAKEAILSGIIFCNQEKIIKPSMLIEENDFIEIKGATLPYVSRAGLKFAKAITEFNIKLENKIMLDIGSSTGGFTDCAIQNGIKKVIAVDVGKDQMDNTLRNNCKVELYEQLDFRNIDLDIIKNADIVAIDVSFISTKLLLPKLSQLNKVEEIVCLIKPQFECGKELADKYRGIVLDKKVHTQVIGDVVNNFSEINYTCQKLSFSPIRGGDGNIEYLAYFTKGIKKEVDIKSVVENAFKYHNNN